MEEAKSVNEVLGKPERTPLSKAAVAAAFEAAFAAPVGPRERAYGCGRVYVSFCGLTRPEVNALAAAAKKLGKIFQRKAAYGFTNALYIGYDNADGGASARGKAIAESFKAAGLPCYVDYGED